MYELEKALLDFHIEIPQEVGGDFNRYGCNKRKLINIDYNQQEVVINQLVNYHSLSEN